MPLQLNKTIQKLLYAHKAFRRRQPPSLHPLTRDSQQPISASTANCALAESPSKSPVLSRIMASTGNYGRSERLRFAGSPFVDESGSMINDRYLDDFKVGERADLGSFTLSEADIIEFAVRYDPQPFHTDPEAAKESSFGGLVASGWHSVSAAMRLLVESFVPKVSAMGSPGIDELRWTKPVRPGVPIHVTYLVEAVVPSTSKPDRGHIVGYCEATDPSGEVVMHFRGRGIYRRRPV